MHWTDTDPTVVLKAAAELNLEGMKVPARMGDREAVDSEVGSQR